MQLQLEQPLANHQDTKRETDPVTSIHTHNTIESKIRIQLKQKPATSTYKETIVIYTNINNLWLHPYLKITSTVLIAYI